MNKKQAVQLLKKYSPDDRTFRIVLRHAIKVREVAEEIAQRIPEADLNLVRCGALLHDIGRYKCPPWKDSERHGIEGAKILRAEGHCSLARIAERHLGGGLRKEDIIERRLRLPRKDFLPLTTEEKIVCYADKLVGQNDECITLSSTLESFKKKFGIMAANRIAQLHSELTGLIKSGGSKPGKAKGRAKKARPKDNSKG
ncbi:MAG: HD domain-containing protein [Candidatus Woesearchaeota archaeon]